MCRHYHVMACTTYGKAHRYLTSIIALWVGLGVLAALGSPEPAACSSAWDCSLNGVCVDGVCVCDTAWRGSGSCDVLAVLPQPSQALGYHNETYSSWGGNVLEANDMFHMMVAQMTEKCELGSWGSNSAIIRAMSNSAAGPFKYADTVIPPFAHNPTIRKLPNDEGYVIYMIGGTPAVPKNCTTSFKGEGIRIRSSDSSTEIRVSTAPTIVGPWSTPIQVDIINPSEELFSGGTNPSPHIDPNGTVTLALQMHPKNPKHNWELVGVARASSWRGPFKLLSPQPISHGNPLCVAGREEDPFLWRGRLGWHIISHGMCPSGLFEAHHHFSHDAVTWKQSPRQPYSYSVRFSNGTSHTFARVERPQLHFASPNYTTGTFDDPDVLYNGVCDGIECLSMAPEAKLGKTYTLARILAVDTPRQIAPHVEPPSTCWTRLPPTDWQSAIAAGNMIFSACIVGSFNLPTLGNGFISWKVGPNCDFGEPCMEPEPPRSSRAAPPRKQQLHSSPLTDAQNSIGGMHMAGVFNGRSNYTVSHRARLPALLNIEIQSSGLEYVGAALDVKRAMLINRTLLNLPGICTAQIEQRVYAHRTRMQVAVLEIEVSDLRIFDTAAADLCSVRLQSYERVSFNNNADFTFQVNPLKNNITTAAGTTILEEVPGYVNATSVGLAWDDIPEVITLSNNETQNWIAVMRSTIEPQLSGKGAIEVANEALLMHNSASAVSRLQLFEEHVEGWNALWQSGIHVEGNLTVAHAINASLYSILSAIRDDIPYGLSPGGLATNSYDGRSFWDTETWMFPILDVLHPTIGKSVLQYRLDRLPAARIRAFQYGVKGAMFPWTSTLSGFGDVHVPNGSMCPPNCTGIGWQEQHISGDIVMAFRLHWRTYHDIGFLKSSWPLIEGVCEFWDSRLEKEPVSGNWTVKGVIGPDEPAGVQDDELYTNAIAASCFQFALEVASVLNLTIPSAWKQKASSPYLPLSDTLSPGNLVHPEFKGYSGQAIMQSSIALLQYPLDWPIPDEIKRADLLYYEKRTKQNGFFTGDSVYSIAWLALDNCTAARTQWESALAHMDTKCYFQFREELSGGHLNFITGAGGFLQNVIQGWFGLRILPDKMAINSPNLPSRINKLSVRGLHYRGFCIDVSYNSSHCVFVLCSTQIERSNALVLVDTMGKSHTLGFNELTVPIGNLALIAK